MVGFCNFIKNNLNILDVFYGPCSLNSNKTSVVGCIGFTGIKTGIAPLPKTFFMVIRFKKDYLFAEDSQMLSTLINIENLLCESVYFMDKNYDNLDTTKNLIAEYRDMHMVLHKKMCELSINNNIENFDLSDLTNKLKSVQSLTEDMRKKEQLIIQNSPYIRFYCDDKLPLYKAIKYDLFDYIKH